MRGIRKLRKAYDEVPQAQVLITGHTDTQGGEAYNTTLSLERADSISAFLRDDAAAWLAWYGADRPNEKRWGAREDQSMLTALPEGKTPYLEGPATGVRDARTTEAVRQFQSDEGLKADGVAGPETRRRLIERYMALEETSLPAGATVVTHGCGESFPEVDTGDGVAEQKNRRVEVFLFSGEITPPPAGKTSSKGSTEYPQWRKQVGETVDLDEAGEDGVPLHVQLHDDTYRPCAGVAFRVLPESGDEVGGVTDAEGWAFVIVPGDGSKPVRIEYPSSSAPDAPLNVATVALVDRKQESDEALRAHLQNLGFFHAGEPQDAAVLRFQAARRLPRSGTFDDETRAAILRAVGGGNDSVTQELQT
jgi:peptidoglycan hydrolase-like protein with peptidoglycan-binding domain